MAGAVRGVVILRFLARRSPDPAARDLTAGRGQLQSDTVYDRCSRRFDEVRQQYSPNSQATLTAVKFNYCKWLRGARPSARPTLLQRDALWQPAQRKCRFAASRMAEATGGNASKVEDLHAPPIRHDSLRRPPNSGGAVASDQRPCQRDLGSCLRSLGDELLPEGP